MYLMIWITKHFKSRPNLERPRGQKKGSDGFPLHGFHLTTKCSLRYFTYIG